MSPRDEGHGNEGLQSQASDRVSKTPLLTLLGCMRIGGFLLLCRRLGIEDLHFHDLRHEATSRFFEKGLNPVEVATITGLKDMPKFLYLTYLRAEDLVGRLG
jgi:integrase